MLNKDLNQKDLNYTLNRVQMRSKPGIYFGLNQVQIQQVRYEESEKGSVCRNVKLK